MAYDNEGARAEVALLKNKFKTDLKPYCPSIREQGKISSCVGWSVGYAAMTIEKAVANKWANDRHTIDDNAYSAMFIFNQIKLGGCDFGAELAHAFTFLKDKGNVPFRDFAVESDCDSVPVGTLTEKAKLHRVKDFATLFNPDDKPDVKIERVKLTLAHQKPVVIGMVVLENFLTLKSNDHMWYPTIGKTDLFGGHAMVVIGYDDSKKAFEIMNSWGKGWANNGFVWIRYEDFAKYCKYAYQLILDKEDVNYLEGTIQVLKPVMRSVNNDGVNSIIFSALPFVYKNNRYELKGENITLPLKFQLVAEGLRKDSYLYVVGFDRKLEPTVHWPRDENLNRQFIAEYESAVIPSHETRITIPGKYNVFDITEPGTEYLCILNSNSQIKNLTERMKQLNDIKGDLVSRLQKIFNNKVVTHLSTSENNGRISFYASGNKSEIVSILLEFDTH
jgi:hypothetical protein